MRGKLDLRVMDYVSRWRFSTRFLINHYLGKSYSTNAALFTRLLEKRQILKVKKDHYTLYIPSSVGAREMHVRTGFDYPSAIKPSRLPTRSLYHDMLVQYVANLLMNEKPEERFQVKDRFQTAAMMSGRNTDNIPDVVIYNDKETLIVEVELWVKDKKRIYRRLLFSLKQAYERNATRIVFVFRNDSHRHRYLSFLEQQSWPILNYKSDKRTLIETDNYELHDSDRELFEFKLLSELDGLTDDQRKIL